MNNNSIDPRHTEPGSPLKPRCPEYLWRGHPLIIVALGLRHEIHQCRDWSYG